MKAAVLEGVEKPLVIKQVADPVPGAGFVRVRLQTAALNHRDLRMQKGRYSGLKSPIILGSDGTGVVEAGGASYRDADWAAQLQRRTRLFNVIVDGAMGEGFAHLIELTHPGGRIAFNGATAGNPPGFDARKVFFRQMSLLGTTMGSPADFAAMVRLVEARHIMPVIDTLRPLERAEQALRRTESAAQFGKIVLTLA